MLTCSLDRSTGTSCRGAHSVPPDCASVAIMALLRRELRPPVWDPVEIVHCLNVAPGLGLEVIGTKALRARLIIDTHSVLFERLCELPSCTSPPGQVLFESLPSHPPLNKRT
jgi:hypothetical protein